MKPQNTFDEIAALERDAAALAPQVREAFRWAGGPSATVEEAIRQEAARVAARARVRWPVWSLRRLQVVAVACLVLLLAAGGLLLTSPQVYRAKAVRQTAHVGTRPAGGASEDAAGFARLLLNIQGLDEDSFVTDGASEALWL
ncbi:MAG TPA: hypothetical protein P5125_08490 [Kiritimatiellia bacterium]|jgi:hypothetical protein|nr:hypothetical protein [Kiritimatiellia bacterium]HOM58479.1 hypothetical protein [Kiritimatiellia bacterium]HOR97108.1 hypothetical protein [Kiritimatiellia bacterium]HPK37026.1 hypothetical protein [Kiritimatiellia bacterium]HPW75212.1 hypothetical protein [Kiritimatiellia bacterium]